MPKGYRIKFLAKSVIGKVGDATVDGVDDTLAECVRVVKPLTPVETSILQGSMRLEPAKRQGSRVHGQWGSFDVNYALWVEIGSHGRPGVHMLERTADQVYPSLAGNIKKHLG